MSEQQRELEAIADAELFEDDDEVPLQRTLGQRRMTRDLGVFVTQKQVDDELNLDTRESETISATSRGGKAKQRSDTRRPRSARCRRFPRGAFTTHVVGDLFLAFLAYPVVGL